MSEQFPYIQPNVKLFSVVLWRMGYLATIEERVPVNFHPYFMYVRHTGEGKTPCKAIVAALDLIKNKETTQS